jgi:hypothetical protein
MVIAKQGNNLFPGYPVPARPLYSARAALRVWVRPDEEKLASTEAHAARWELEGDPQS